MELKRYIDTIPLRVADIAYKVRFVFSAFIITLCIGLTPSCSKDGDTVYVEDLDDVPDTSPLVIVVYDPNAMGDHSYNDLVYQGVETAARQYGLRTLQGAPASTTEGLMYLESLLLQMSTPPDTIRRLLIVVGNAYDEYLRKNNNRLESNPYIDLLYMETDTPLEGKGSTLYIHYYGAMFEAGALAPHFADEVLLVGANPEYEVIKESIEGFTAGFNSGLFPTDHTLSLQTTYLSDRVDGGFMVADSTALRILNSYQWAQDLPLLVPICGGSSNTFQGLAETLNDYFYMGVDAAPTSVFCPYSTIKNVDLAVARCISQWFLNKSMPKHMTFGLEDGYTDVVIHDITDNLYPFLYKGALTSSLVTAIHQEAIRKEAEYGK